MRKYLICIIGLILILSAVSCDGSSALSSESTDDAKSEYSSINFQTGAESDFNVEENENGLTILGYTGTSADLEIPETISGKSVTKIGEFAFDTCSITSIKIPDTVIELETGAFSNCYYLKNVLLGSNLQIIGEGAFACCDQISEIEFPSGLLIIGPYSFYECWSLNNVNITENVEQIGEYAFYDCQSLESITIPENAETLGAGIFSCCSALSSAVIRCRTVEIPEAFFYECESLSSVEYPDSVETIGENAFIRCYGLTEITIPENVKCISDGVFFGCENLLSVIIESESTQIGFEAIGYTEGESGISVLIDGLKVSCKSGSQAEKYCEECKIELNLQ